MNQHGIVIIGAGEAGTRAALALRERGFAGPVRLIGAEHYAPYERPPLSKATLTGEGGGLPAIAADFSAHSILFTPGIRVNAIDRAARRLHLEGGGEVAYGHLILATGASARKLPVPGGELAVTLRDFDDAKTLREKFRAGQRILVIGGGFIGLELAASARQLGCEVIVLESQLRLLARTVPTELAEILAARHRAEGVRILCGAGLSHVQKTAGGLETVMADATVLAADCIIAGIGAAPDTALAAAAGLDIDNGIAVDSHLATPDPHISAIGDCAAFPHPRDPARRIRLEAWRNAQDQGNYLAGHLTGEAGAYAGTPWFWSGQYDLHLQIAGLADGAVQTVTRVTGPDARILFHLDAAGRLIAASGLGPLSQVAREMRLAEMLVAQGVVVAAAALADPATKLKQLLRG